MASLRDFVHELRRRHVFRVAVVYLVIAWAMIQVSATTFPMVGVPEWAPTLVLALFIIGFPVALALAWAYDVTPQGVVRAEAGSDTGARAPARARARQVPAAASDRPRSLAVLPFADLSRERDQEYLGDGIAEEILNVLASVASLRVAARTSSFAFK